MNVQEVEKVLSARPFEPFGIYLSDGLAYPVPHPYQVILTPRAAHVSIGGTRNGWVMRDVVICALVHINCLGPLPKASRKRRKWFRTSSCAPHALRLIRAGNASDRCKHPALALGAR